MPKPVTLMDFLERAKTSLEEPKTGSLSGGKVVSWIRNPKGREKPVGQIFARLLWETALPSEIRAAEARYNISLEKLKNATELDARDVLAFCGQLIDTRMSLMNTVMRGMESVKVDFDTIQTLKIMKTQAVRDQVLEFFSREEVQHLKTSNGSKKGSVLGKDLIRLGLSKTPMTQQAYFEILTKHLASGFLEEGMIIPVAPLIQGDGTVGAISEGGFVVQRVISAKGLMVFALVPFNTDPAYKPTLLFRPTTPSSKHANALETIADDVSTQIGKRSFEMASTSIQQLLEDPTFITPGNRAHVCGFSLGGNHASRTLARFPDKFEKAYFYNDPYTEEAVAKEFTKNLLASSHTSDRPLEIYIDQTDKDVVTHAGEVHVGYIEASYHSGFYEAQSKCSIKVTRFSSSETEGHTDAVPDVSSRELLMSPATRHRVMRVFQERAEFHTQLTRSTHLRTRSLTDVTASEESHDILHISNRPIEIQRVNRRRRNMVTLRTIIFCFAITAQFFINCNQYFTSIGRRRVQIA